MILVLVIGVLIIASKINLKESSKKVIKLIKKHFSQIVIAIVLIIGVGDTVYNAVFCMKLIKEEASKIEQRYYSGMIDIYGRLINNLKEYDHSLYRTEMPVHLSANNGLIFGYNGMSYSSSTYSKSLYEFLRNIGSYGVYVHIKYNLEMTKAADMLLGIKYILVPPNTEFIKEYNVEYEDLFVENNVKIYRNPYYLALGYVVNKNIFDANTEEEKNQFEFQNEVIKKMSGIEENIYIPQKGKIDMSTSGISNNSFIYTKINDDAKLTYEFEVESEDDLYVNFVAVGGENCKLYINGEEKRTIFNDSDSEIIDLGKRKVGEKIKIELMLEKEEVILRDMSVYYEKEDILSKHYEKLKQNQVDMKQIDNRTFEGTINIKNDNEYVMFTIPYEKGFSITVDGEKVEYENLLNTFIGINLKEGEHKIVIKYMPDKIVLGSFATIIGIIFFAGFIIIKRNKR